ncbi:MAG TPA: lipoprotein [Cyclobacteriaceae bacterium]|nr:lipoprotein [Cyclobacteriaceae bacterium]
MRKILFVIVSVTILTGCGNNPSATTESTEKAAAKPSITSATGVPELKETKDASGKLLSSGYLLDGMKESSWLEYYDNGIIKTLTTYYHDKKEGVAIEFTTNGSVSKRCNYHNDLREGEYKEYNYGNVHEERTYVNGKIEGIVKVYYDTNLNVMEEGNYKNGVRDGVSKWYDQNGNLTIEYTYKNGELVKK